MSQRSLREDDDSPWGADEPAVRSDFSTDAGHCGCGQLGRCYIDFPCQCCYDHGQWFPCAEHRHLDDLSLEEELGLRP